MNVNLRHLEAFAAVARLCSFTAAARVLNLSQPALTVQIRQLEETLTVRLLDRNTRLVRLTRAGEELAPVVERLLAEIDSVVSSAKAMSGKTKGAVNVAALPSIAATLLPRIIVGFRRRYPGVSVMVHDVVADRVAALVRSEHVDLGLGESGRRRYPHVHSTVPGQHAFGPPCRIASSAAEVDWIGRPDGPAADPAGSR